MVAIMAAHAKSCFGGKPGPWCGAGRRFWPVIAVLVLLAALSGCGGEPRAAVLPATPAGVTAQAAFANTALPSPTASDELRSNKDRSVSALDPLYSGFGYLNGPETSWCRAPSRQPLCFRAYLIHAIDARSSTKSLFGDKTHNNAADAYRHCYWSARMTLDFGAADAEGFGDRHEDVSPDDQPPAERNMDLTNNRHGRKAGQLVSTDEAASALCQDWSQDGTLQTSP